MTPPLDTSLMKFIPTGSNNSNAAYGIVNAGQNIAQNPSEENIVQSVVSIIPSLWNLVGVDEGNNASKQAGQNTEKEASLKNSIQTTQDKVNSDMSPIIAKLEENAKTVQENIELANKKQEEKDKAQKKLDEQTEVIANCKRILENPDSVPGERTAAIAKLKGANTAITNYMTDIENIFNEVQESQENVSTISDENENLNSDLSNVQQNGQTEINNNVTAYQQCVTENTAMETTGKINEVTSQAAGRLADTLEASASASSAIPGLGGAISETAKAKAQQMRSVERTNHEASEIRQQGAAANNANLNLDNSAIQTNLDTLNNFSNMAVGSYNDSINYTQTFEPIITSVGSYAEKAEEKLKNQPEELGKAIENAEVNVAQNNNSAQQNNNAQNNNQTGNNNSDNNSQEHFVFQYNPNNLKLEEV